MDFANCAGIALSKLTALMEGTLTLAPEKAETIIRRVQLPLAEQQRITTLIQQYDFSHSAVTKVSA